MLVKLPERIISDKWTINLSDSWGTTENVHFIPTITDNSEQFIIDDPFIQGAGTYNHKSVYHAKLPWEYICISDDELTEAAIAAGLIGSGARARKARTTASPTRYIGWSAHDMSSYEEAFIYWPGINQYMVCTASGGGRGDPTSLTGSYWVYDAYYYLYENVRVENGRVYAHEYRAHLYQFTDRIFQKHYFGTTLSHCSASVPDRGNFSDRGEKVFSMFPVTPKVVLPDFTENLFNEELRMEGYPGWLNQLQFDWLLQHAFYDACQGIGKMNDNNIQNILQIVGDIAGICETFGIGTLELAEDAGKPAIRKLKKNSRKFTRALNGLTNYDVQAKLDQAGSSWLKYRYGYSTSKMDYDEFVRYVNHKMDTYIAFLDPNFKEIVHGESQLMVGSSLVRMHCSIAYRPRTYEGLKSCCRYVHDMGLELNPYVLWDMVPYSFIVDWVAPVGDVLDVISNEIYYSEEYYDFSDVEFSVNYTMYDKDGREEGRRYYRWYQRPPKLDSSYWFDKGLQKPSTKTKLKRAGDVFSLVISRI